MECIPREALDELAYLSQQRADRAIREGPASTARSCRCIGRTALSLDREEFPRPQTTAPHR
jgi:acetyl-CoA C-acetyltransferase